MGGEALVSNVWMIGVMVTQSAGHNSSQERKGQRLQECTVCEVT